MIDLIIPYYNNRIGLLNTLKSIDQSIFKVTIIDDHSTEPPLFPLDAAQCFRVNINSGPGFARQLGIEKTSNEYIMFLDTGDVFLSPEAQTEILDLITNNPNVNFWSFPYFHYGQLTKDTDNRLHGKVYKRKFLEEYGITFAQESSYLDEDVGFNRTCRLCTEMKFINKAVIEQIKDENSLTQKDNQASFYKNQTRALAQVSIHTIEICRKNNISTEEEINQIAIALYYWFIRVAAERPEYIQDAWSGARIFYTKLAQDIKPNQLALGNVYLKKCLQYRNQISFPINILRFANEIQKNEIIPDKYLTFDKI